MGSKICVGTRSKQKSANSIKVLLRILIQSLVKLLDTIHYRKLTDP